jgi:YfiH family protein
LNFSRKREQNNQNFLENLKRFADAAGFDYRNAVAINYAHSANLYRAQASDAGCGIVKEGVPSICDGLYTTAVDLPLMSFHADCVPLYFYDPKMRCAAVCHAGWKGTAAHMAKCAVSSLLSAGCSPGNILAAVGPCISAERYQVGSDVAGIFLKEFGEGIVETGIDGTYVDIAKACIIDIIGSGVSPKNITAADLCTYNESNLFFSHRRDKGKTGAMAAVIMLTQI